MVCINKLTELFCSVDDHCQKYEFFHKTRALGKKKRGYPCRLSLSEIVTILIAFHISGFRTFKQYYLYMQIAYKHAFQDLVTYHRFVELIPRGMHPLCSYLKTRFGSPTGISFIDSTSLRVCKNKRIPRNKVFKGLAKRGKSTMGWFFGFKLHFIINEKGDLLSAQITAGNRDDRSPVKNLSKSLRGKLFGDKGYISLKLFKELLSNGLQLITTVKKGMKNKFISLRDKILLRKRSLIETVIDQLKNIYQIEHSRSRSVTNYMVNIVSGLVAYTFRDKKPRINFSDFDKKILNIPALFQV